MVLDSFVCQYHHHHRGLIMVDCQNDTGTLPTLDATLCPTLLGGILCTLVCVVQFDQSKHSLVQQTHEWVLEGWKQVIVQADQISMYWPIHVHVDMPSSTITTTNLLLGHDVNDNLDDIADAVIHQHHCATGTEMCFDIGRAELDVTKALVQLVDVALMLLLLMIMIGHMITHIHFVWKNGRTKKRISDFYTKRKCVASTHSI